VTDLRRVYHKLDGKTEPVRTERRAGGDYYGGIMGIDYGQREDEENATVRRD